MKKRVNILCLGMACPSTPVPIYPQALQLLHAPFPPLTPSPIVPCSLRRSEPLKNGVGEAGEVGNSFGGKKWEQQEREKEEDGDKCRAEKCEEDTY